MPVADAAVLFESTGRYAYTDRSGRFVISNVPRGEFRITLVRETIPENAEVLHRPASVAIVRAGETVDGADFLLEVVEVQPTIERLPTERVRVQER